MPSVMRDDPEQIKHLGERASAYLRLAEQHEAKAADYRRRARGCAEQLNRIVGKNGSGPRHRRRGSPKAEVAAGRPIAASGETKVTAKAVAHATTVTGAIRSFAKQIGRPFTVAEVVKVMREVNPATTTGPLYHLIRQREIAVVRRGLFIDPLLLEDEARAREEGEADRAATN